MTNLAQVFVMTILSTIIKPLFNVRVPPDKSSTAVPAALVTKRLPPAISTEPVADTGQ